MRPMSLWESGDSTGDVSLEDLFNTPQSISGLSATDLEKIAFLTCRGGWPLAVSMKEEIALDQAFDYIEAVIDFCVPMHAIREHKLLLVLRHFRCKQTASNLLFIGI